MNKIHLYLSTVDDNDGKWDSIRFWQSGGSPSSIYDVLKYGKSYDKTNTKKITQHIANIDSLIEKSKINKRLTAYRGIRWTENIKETIKKGAIITSISFRSFTTNRDYALTFAREGSIPILFVLNVPAGTHALLIPDRGILRNEHEVLFARNTVFKVISSKKQVANTDPKSYYEIGLKLWH